MSDLQEYQRQRQRLSTLCLYCFMVLVMNAFCQLGVCLLWFSGGAQLLNDNSASVCGLIGALSLFGAYLLFRYAP
jgi:hypothetical protein